MNNSKIVVVETNKGVFLFQVAIKAESVRWGTPPITEGPGSFQLKALCSDPEPLLQSLEADQLISIFEEDLRILMGGIWTKPDNGTQSFHLHAIGGNSVTYKRAGKSRTAKYQGREVETAS